MGTFSHSLSLFSEPIEPENYPVQILAIIWEIPVLRESIKTRISTIDMAIHDHRNLFAIHAHVLEYIYTFGFCLDNSLDPDCT